jgi:hypothetical protein
MAELTLECIHGILLEFYICPGFPEIFHSFALIVKFVSNASIKQAIKSCFAIAYSIKINCTIIKMTVILNLNS